VFNRKILKIALSLLESFPALAILGPRQVGKTTLAKELSQFISGKTIYLDLEKPSDLIKMEDAELYFQEHPESFIIIDEIQRSPELFPLLRSIIDERRQAGKKGGQFLLLGSASLELLKQSSESLAGRLHYLELTGLLTTEVADADYQQIIRLWNRGGFPESFLAASDELSFIWRQSFIRSYLERDIPQWGPRIPAETLRRFWTMLAHNQGNLWNASTLAASLGSSVPTINRYLDLLVDLLLVRTLRPWSNNSGKRLVKTPKVYIRDSGLVHALLQLNTSEDILSHPIAGKSWEGLIIENIIAELPVGATIWFYRSSAGAEIDLLIEYGSMMRVAIEIKRSSTPKIMQGFYNACEDVKATHRYVIYSGNEIYTLTKGVKAIPITELKTLMEQLNLTNK
jgi:predicted AAA+ superfamily ATPase